MNNSEIWVITFDLFWHECSLIESKAVWSQCLMYFLWRVFRLFSCIADELFLWHQYAINNSEGECLLGQTKTPKIGFGLKMNAKPSTYTTFQIFRKFTWSQFPKKEIWINAKKIQNETSFNFYHPLFYHFFFEKLQSTQWMQMWAINWWPRNRMEMKILKNDTMKNLERTEICPFGLQK